MNHVELKLRIPLSYLDNGVEEGLESLDSVTTQYVEKCYDDFPAYPHTANVTILNSDLDRQDLVLYMKVVLHKFASTREPQEMEFSLGRMGGTIYPCKLSVTSEGDYIQLVWEFKDS